MHDERLGRDVAVKILRRPFSIDPRRRERFDREARILAALNHPNIGAIYGHEDVDGTPALVLELVDGETLDERMARPMSQFDALVIARAIAEALEAAHDRGVIHRDLKPANIKITPDGVVKVLDFGLAKLAAEESEEIAAAGAQLPTTRGLSTREGTIVGTVAYMSPEQAMGKPADKRSDLWAFGVVLLEMLSGRPVFTGHTDSDLLASVVRAEPDMAVLPAETPAALRKLLRRCLEKDRKRRLDSATAARLEIEDALAPAAVDVPVGAASSRRVAAIAMTAFAGLALTASVAWMLQRPVSEEHAVTSRFAIVTPPAQPLNVASNDRDLALSPDGRYLVYRAGGSTTSGSALFLRAIGQLDARPLAAINNAYGPFFSPDSRWIAFFENAQLKKVSVTGGPVMTLAPVIGGPLGASWGDNGTIVFATDDPTTGLWRVSADGNADPEIVTKPDAAQMERDHGFPSVLPGGAGVLFTVIAAGQPNDAQVVLLDLKTGKRRTLVHGGNHAEYVDRLGGDGRGACLIYAAGGTLHAVGFDPVRLDLLGDPVAVVERVMMKSSGAANYAVSRPGTLVYVPEGAVRPTPVTSLVWVDRSGREQPIDAPPRSYGPPRLSPDGTRVAVGFLDQGDTDIWIWDLARAISRRLTISPGMDGLPNWTADGRQIIFMSARMGALNWYAMDADGSGGVERLTTSTFHQWPTSVSPDGARVFGFEIEHSMARRVITTHVSDLDSARDTRGEQRVEQLFEGVFPEISPNGRYIAYQSDEFGRPDIYVRPFPQVDGGRWQISTGGGTRAAWARNGRELFYLDNSNYLTAVAVQTDGTFVAGKPAQVLEMKYAEPNPSRHYDVSPDGRRFLVLKERSIDPNATPASIVVVERWFEELKARIR